MSGRKFSGSITITEKYGKKVPQIEALLANLNIASHSLDSIYHQFPEFADQFHNTIRLRGKPVTAIVNIVAVESGIEISSSRFTLENHSTLVFDTWLTEELEVTYTYGKMPPAAGKMAARALATQFSLAWGDRSDECTLPDRVVSVNRQNVSWVLLDNQDFISDLRTGVYAVDLFLKSVNPDRATQRSKVFSPDIKRGRRVTPINPTGYGTGGYGQ